MQTSVNTTLISEAGHRSPEGRLLVVSNRGPIEYVSDGAGGLKKRRAAGGLATALECVAQSRPVTWISSATKRMVIAGGASAEFGDGGRLRTVVSSPEAYGWHYGVFCNPILWFLQHSLWPDLRRADSETEALYAWEHGYLPVNESFGKAVAEELGGSPGAGQVMLHDYHLYAAPLVIRERVPGAVLQHFVHIPWPEPEEWQHLPRVIVESICRGLLANDSVVFQTEQCARNFSATCHAFLSDAHVAGEGAVVVRQGNRTRVWANPISVDVSDLHARLASPETMAYYEKLAPELGERTIVRVDRLDPSKNVVAGFQAFDLLLKRHPEWAGRVRFLCFLVPSRGSIPEYRAYSKETFDLVRSINARHGRPGWTPIKVYHEHNRLQALVAMSLYDVLLVNSYRDGMNLVSKEGPVVNRRDGVLVLSETAGAYSELRDGALCIPPDDIEGTAAALDEALRMSAAERRERAALLRYAVLDHDLDDWLDIQLDDLATIQNSAGVVGSAIVGR